MAERVLGLTASNLTSAAAHHARHSQPLSDPGVPPRFERARGHANHAELCLHTDLALAPTVGPRAPIPCPPSLCAQIAPLPAVDCILRSATTHEALIPGSARLRAIVRAPRLSLVPHPSPAYSSLTRF